MNNWRKGLRKNKQTKYLIDWEHEQKVGYIATGIILGSVGVLAVYFLMVYLYG